MCVGWREQNLLKAWGFIFHLSEYSSLYRELLSKIKIFEEIPSDLGSYLNKFVCYLCRVRCIF